MKLVLSILFSFLLSTSLMGDKLLDDFKTKANKLATSLDEMNTQFSDTYANYPSRLTKEEWEEAGARFNYAMTTFQSAVYAESLCQMKKGEGYCMDADKDLVIVEVEVKLLEEFEEKSKVDKI